MAICTLLLLCGTNFGLASETAAPFGMSPADIAIGRNALAAVRDGDFDQAIRHAGRMSNPLPEPLIVWYGATRSSEPLPFPQIASFLCDHPHWPQTTRVRRHAEQAMPVDDPPEAVVRWFKTFPPVSTVGRSKLAHAFVELGRSSDAERTAKEAWRTGDFTNTEQHVFLSEFSSFLTTEDHRQRIDRLLWNGQVSAADRMLDLLPEQDRRLAIERIKLRRNKTTPQQALARVSREQRTDPGLLYEMARWHRKRDENDEALQLIESLPGDRPHASAWWRERSILARRFLAESSPQTAYRLAANHGLKSGADFAEAEWFAGWIALRFKDDPQQAFDHFIQLYDGVRYPISRARGAYWTARAAESLGKQEERETWYNRAAIHQNVFYGQLAHEAITPGTPLTFERVPPPTQEEEHRFEDNELVNVARFLASLEERFALRSIILHLAQAEKTSQWRQLTASLAANLGRPDLAVFVARRSDRDGHLLLESGYPIIELPASDNPSPDDAEAAFVHAVIRQESSFDLQAISQAGARGLMQLMPPTARSVSRKLNLSYSLPKLTTSAEYNLSLGQAYMNTLLARFSGSYLLSLAGYNAGPRRADHWLQSNGDPRAGVFEAIDWAEKIPFSETRNYVQRTLENLQVYRWRLAGSATPSSLGQDLVR